MLLDLGYESDIIVAVRNNSARTVTGFYCLRYAVPPIGNFRLQPPIINYSASIPLNATTIGPQCMQGVPAWQTSPYNLFGAAVVPGSEDCLLLNVVVPTRPKARNLPVLFQIHGGGYVQGNSTSNDGTLLVSKSNGSIIYVEIQYRLRGLMFLSSQKLRANRTANASLLDQRAALE